MASEATPTLHATVRDPSGSSGAKQVRDRGLVPAVCYGHGIDNISIAIEPTEFDKIVETPHGLNSVVQIELDDGETIDNLMLRDYQVEPIKRVLQHADFVAMDPEDTIRVRVPLKPEGEAEGVKEGGRLQFIHREVEVFVSPVEIPESITVDVTDLTPDDAIMADDLEFPDGVEPAHKVDYAVLRIQMPREEQVIGEAEATTAATTPTTEEELEEGEEPVEGEEAEEDEGPGASARAPGA